MADKLKTRGGAGAKSARADYRYEAGVSATSLGPHNDEEATHLALKEEVVVMMVEEEEVDKDLALFKNCKND